MALWAFHNNPGIGGFGESNHPVLFDGDRIHPTTSTTSKKRNGRRERTKKQSKEASFSSNCENRVPHGISSCHDGTSGGGDGDDVCSMANKNEYSIGEGDLICQIVKELVDNAVDACRSPVIPENDHLQNKRSQGTQKKRIRVDIKPFTTSGGVVGVSTAAGPSNGQHRDGVLQVTVTDTGCGMENIQKCVNAFQSSKDGDRDQIIRNYSNSNSNSNNNNNNSNNSNNNTSGRYGIGLTLCLLHAQRCVPNSRACISSATPRSKFRTRAFFEVDKQEDVVKCVEEEVTASQQESGTCVSLLVPGGTAAKLAWPRLKDYFTRFRLCTKGHFELDVFAPTLSKLPIYIRPRQVGKDQSRDLTALKKRECALEPARDYPNSDEWDDLLDGDDGEQESDNNDVEALLNTKKLKENDYADTNNITKIDPHRYDFVHAVQSFWPKSSIVYDNVARSVRDIRNYNHRTTPAEKEEARNSGCQMEVNMVVCPRSENDEIGNSSYDSAATTSSEVLSGDETAAKLKLVRIVNGVPIMESAEAHSCGLVHGISNKGVWGSFGLDIDRGTTVAPDTSSSSTPSFLLRDNSLIAPFINKNLNHKQLKVDDYNSIHSHDNKAEKKKRERDQKDLLPANVRIGTILVVVQIRAAPSSLPLPSLSKGRLPLNHQPIDSALQLGLRDCIVSLQSTNPSLFLTTSKLRTVERDVRYIPGMASAVSRIICRSGNQSLLRCKSLELFLEKSTGNHKKIRQEPTFEVRREQEYERKDSKVITMSSLANAFESRLRLAIKIRNESMRTRRRKRQKVKTSVKDEEYQDFDSEKESKNGEDSLQEGSVSISNECSFSLSSSTCGQTRAERASGRSLHSQSLQRLPVLQQRFEKYSCEEYILPMKEIVIENGPTQSTNDDDEDNFDDWL